MRKAFKAASSKLSEESGQGLVEYALIVAGIAVVAVAAIQLIGGNITTTLNKIASSL